MKTKLLTLAAALLLASCATQPPPSAPPGGPPKMTACTGATCQVDITVVDQGASCKITSVQPEFLDVARGTQNIRFRIVRSDAKYKFEPNGIAFPFPQPPQASLPPGRKAPPAPADPRPIFPPGLASGGNSPVFVIVDNNTNENLAARGYWKYDIHVHDGGSRKCRLDPGVDNN